MYDSLTGRYTLACPTRGGVQILLSSFRTLKRIPGASHPAVYQITFACPCNDEHQSLVAHDELDWRPLMGPDVPFFNFMTSRLDSAEADWIDRQIEHIRGGEWPWLFYCYPEEAPQPAFPSNLRAIAPAQNELGVAVACPTCERTSVNLVSPRHLDVPFYNDSSVAVVEYIFASDRLATLAAFRENLHSAVFDAHRRSLSR